MEPSQQQKQQQQQHQQEQQQQERQQHPPTKPLLHTHFSHLPLLPLRSATSTPMSSPGLFNPSPSRHGAGQVSFSESNTPAPQFDSPYLHPLQGHQVRETHKALIDSDLLTGRKSINQYEVIEELGRGVHGKVKLARNLATGENVAIKIIPRFSKRRRLGKVTALSPQDKTKREIAILKKIRHPNVVALLEIIDDPELKKIYMVLEHVELGEIVWRKKGLPHVCHYERRRMEREMRGEAPTPEEELYDQMLERRLAVKDLKRARMAQNFSGPNDYWSVEHGAADDGSSSGPWSRVPSNQDFATTDVSASQPISRRSSLAAHSQAYSISSSPSRGQFRGDEAHEASQDLATPGPWQTTSGLAIGSATAPGAHAESGLGFRDRAPSMADSIISHMSSIDYQIRGYDPFGDDYSYVPCFTFEQAKSAFRDTVLGLEYLHYQGVVHRDIKPANLLWSKDHRVKISDFGVSYFGRPIRDGEPDDLVSESEAKDFDDDLELSKTVGTPAFFAPELCFTDPVQEQPKISEQIDVWSLGVTLYCLIFARIPFLAEDEFQMYRKIAKEEVYIPRRRLKPVDPSTSPTATSLYKRQNSYPYRNDSQIEYEDIDINLYDLLHQMLTKNPEKRIRLKDIKRHPWVLEGLANAAEWLEESDPARPTCGRKIQVDERDVSSAVIPLTFLERARSAVKKAVDKVMHPLMDRDGSRSRRRATSSAASSVADSMLRFAPPLPQSHNDRRRSLYPDDHLVGQTEGNALGEGSSSAGPVVAGGGDGNRPDSVAYDPMATALPLRNKAAMGGARSRSGSEDAREQGALARAAQRNMQAQQFLRLAPYLSGPHPAVPGPSSGDDDHDAQRREEVAKSVSLPHSREPSFHAADRSLFISSGKRVSAQVSVDTTPAHAINPPSRYSRQMYSADFGKNRHSYSLSSSPLSCSPHSLAPSSYQHCQPQSDPNFADRSTHRADGRPLTAHRVDKVHKGEGRPCTRNSVSTAAESATEGVTTGLGEVSRWVRERDKSISRGGTMASVKTASSGSIDRLGTPLTCPSEMASPTANFSTAKGNGEQMTTFQSDPSLPALLSGASSISADLEGELLGRPGIIGTQASLLETADSLTPPALSKEPASPGMGMDRVFENAPGMDGSPLSVHPESGQSSSRRAWRSDYRGRADDADEEEEDDEDGSDDGIFIMAKSKRRPPVVTKGPRFEVRRRDTNFSTASDETAKKVDVNGGEGT